MFHPKLKTLSRFLDNYVSQSVAVSIKKHLQRCKKCRERIAVLSNVEKIVSLESELPDTFTDNIVANLPDIRRIKLPEVGVIKGLVGLVTVYRGNDVDGIEGFIGMGLKKGDTVKLMGDSLALVDLKDGSSLWLNRNTEIHFSTGMEKLLMRTGEIFAMMKRQKDTFDIKTPSAVLSVIGTDFDAEAKGDGKTVLKVLKGKVSFRNNTGKTIVSKSRQVEADKDSQLIQTKIKDLNSVSSWTSPIQLPQRRGATVFKQLGFIAVFIVMLITGILFIKGQQQTERPSSTTNDITYNNKSPLTLTSPYLQDGLAWRARIVCKGKNQASGAFESYLEIVTRTEVSDVEQSKDAQVLLTIEDIKANGEIAENPHFVAAAKMTGRQVMYLVSPEGTIHSVVCKDGKRLVDMESGLFWNAFFANNFTMLFPGKSLAPGDKWTSLLELKVPGYPDSYIRVRDRVRFTGYRKRIGRWIAVLQSEFAGEIGGGFPIITEVRANATKRTLLDQLSIDGTMEYIVDVQSGRVVSAQGTYRNNKMEETMEFLAPHQPPVREKTAESLGDEYYYNITIEYLSPETSGNVDTLN